MPECHSSPAFQVSKATFWFWGWGWAVRCLEGFSFGGESLSAFLSTYVRSLAFTLIRVASLLWLSWLYLCHKNWNAISLQSLDEALPRHMTGTVLPKSRWSSNITPLITSSPATRHPVSWGPFQQQRLLAVLRSFPQKGLFSCCCLSEGI